MAWLKKDFHTYVIAYFDHSNFEALIHCYSGAHLVGQMRFFKNNAVIPKPFVEDDCIYINFPIDRFNDIINILRYEKPLSLLVEQEKHIARLTTSYEPIGEQEPS